MSDLEHRVLAAITEEGWLALARELIPTGQPAAENPLDPDLPPGSEEAIALLLAGKLEVLGFTVDTPAKRPGRPNVVGTWAGQGAGPVLIVNDHLDTYPAGDPTAWTSTGGNPYNPTRHGDFLHSRGTSDTRGNLACIVLALRALRQAGFQPAGTLKAVFTVDEEKNGPDGAIFLLDEYGLKGDYEITVEPTAWTGADGDWGVDVAVANSGHCLVEITTRGVKSHIWRPDTGINAVVKAAELIGRLQTASFTHVPPGRYGGTPPSVVVVRIRGGELGEMQFTPDSCTITLAVVGLVPGQTAESVLADIDGVIAQAVRADNSFTAQARFVPGSLFVAATEELPPEAEPAASLGRAYRRLLGRDTRYYRKNAYNDTIRFAHRGINAVTFGPGEDGWPPVNEYIRVQKSVAATKVLALAILDLLGGR